MNSNYLLVMAGGIGSRFWPSSRKAKPKQFHDILGTGKTLIQGTIERFSDLLPKENIMIVAHRDYKKLILEQLPSLEERNLVLEPQGKNTAPCIAYGAQKALMEDENASLIVCPSDHIIKEREKFIDQVKKGLGASSSENKLITLGIQPSRPDTGYGYIKFDQGGRTEEKKVLQFTEKPNSEKAEEFLASGDYLWNSGIFIWKASTIMDEMKAHLPDLYNSFNAIKNKIGTNGEASAIEGVYSKCESISIDYGILERSNDVWVIPSEFGWSDLGTWKALYEMVEKDEDQNHITGEIKTYDVRNSLIKSDDGKLIVAEGLDGYIMIQEGDVTMICRKENEQMVKTFVENLKKDNRKDKFL